MAKSKVAKRNSIRAHVTKDGKRLCGHCKKNPATSPKATLCKVCRPEVRRAQVLAAVHKHRKLAPLGKTTHRVSRKGKLTSWARENPEAAKKLLKNQKNNPLAAKQLKLLEKVRPAA